MGPVANTHLCVRTAFRPAYRWVPWSRLNVSAVAWPNGNAGQFGFLGNVPIRENAIRTPMFDRARPAPSGHAVRARMEQTQAGHVDG